MIGGITSLSVRITEYRCVISGHQLGLVRDTHTAAVLRRRYAPSWFASPKSWIWTADLAAPPGFQWQVDKYAEVVTKDPWDDVVLYFARRARAGGLPVGPGPLFYPGRYPILNSAAMASAAEAIAGWFCRQFYGWELVVRPPRVTPDLIFLEPESRRYALVEVKSSGRTGDVRSKLTTDMIKLLRVLNSSKQLRPGAYFAALVMVQVATASEVVLTSLVLEEPIP